MHQNTIRFLIGISLIVILVVITVLITDMTPPKTTVTTVNGEKQEVPLPTRTENKDIAAASCLLPNTPPEIIPVVYTWYFAHIDKAVIACGYDDNRWCGLETVKQKTCTIPHKVIGYEYPYPTELNRLYCLLATNNTECTIE